MSLVVQCTHCQRRYSLGEQMAGKKVKCKGCETVFVAAPSVVAGDIQARPAATRPPAARQLAAARQPAARQQHATPPPMPPPARMDESDDPFAAMSLLEAGLSQPPETSGPMYARASVSAPPLAAPVGIAHALPYGMLMPPRASVRSNKSIGLDSLTPILLLCFVVGLVVLLIVGLYQLPGKFPNAHPLRIEVAKSALWTMVITFGVAHFAIIAPLCLLAVFVASKIMKFELPGAAYLRSAGVAALPLVVVMGIDVLAPSNPAIRLILIVAIIPLAFYVLQNVFELVLTETLVAFAFTCVFFIVGLVLAMMLSGAVAAAGVVKSEADIRKAIAAEQEQQWRDEMEQRRAERNQNISPRDNVGVTEPPVRVDPLEARAQSLQRRLESFDARNFEAESRESATRDFASLQAEVTGAASLKSRSEWSSIDSLFRSIQNKIAALPSEQPDPSIFLAMPPEASFTPPANGVAALGEEITFDRFNLRPPADARLDLRNSGPSQFRWTLGNSGSGMYSLSVFSRKNTKQQRPWLLSRPFHKAAAEKQNLYFIEGQPGARITYGSIGGVPAAKVEGESAAGHRFVEYVLQDGASWVVFKLQSRGSDSGELDLFELAARTLRPLRAGEGKIDPFAPERVATRLGEDPDGVSAILRKNPIAAEPLVLKLLNSDDSKTRHAAADLLPFVLGEKSLPQIEPMVIHSDSYVAGAVRGMLRKMKPETFDAVAEALLDLKGEDSPKRRQAAEKLAKLTPDPKRRNQVAEALESMIIADSAFGPEAQVIAEALAIWSGDKTPSRLAPLLNNPKLWGPRRDILLTAISGARDKVSVAVVMKWLPQAPEKVTEILISMGSLAEDETIRVLNIYFMNKTAEGATVRAACVNILSEVGSSKCLEVLGRASRDKRDLVVQDAARQAIETIKARVAKPATKPS